MQAGVFGGICLLAFLLSEGKGEELDTLKESKVLQNEDKARENIDLRTNGDLEAPGDLKSELSLGITQSNSRANEGRSGDVAQNDARRDSAMSSAVAQSSGDGSALAYADSFSDSAQSRATAVAGGAPGSPFNPFNEELGPYIPPGSGFSNGDAQAINSNSYGQESNYPYHQSYPYSSGLNLPQAQADNGLYQPSPSANSQALSGIYQQDAYSPYSQGLSPTQAQNQADNGLYQRDPTFNPYGQGLSSGQAQNQADNGFYQPGYNSVPNVSPYNQGSSFPQVPSQGDSESNNPIIEPKSLLPKLAPVSDSHSLLPSSYPYTPVSGISSTHTQENSRPYKPIPVPNPDFSPYDRFLVPYKEPSSTQIQDNSEAYQPVPIIKSKEDRYDASPREYSQGLNSPYGVAPFHSYGQKKPYQAIPQPDPNPSPYDSYLVPYRDPNPPRAQTDHEEYQPVPIPRPSNKQQETIARLYSDRSYSSYSNDLIHNPAHLQSPAESRSYEAIPLPNSETNYPYMVPYIESSYSQKQINNGAYQPIPIPKKTLRTILTRDEISSYESVPVPESEPSRYDSSMAQFREENFQKNQLQNESNAYVPNANDPKSDATLSSSYTAAARSREYNPVVDDMDSNTDPISKSGWDPYEYNPYTPSGAYPQLYPSGAEAAQTYPDNKPAASQGKSPYANYYPSESSVRPGGYNAAENEAQELPNARPSGQSSPLAFEDAKSRAILPHEYVFPNKMPGGENAIQCTKENEFHHFWSQELDCLVCICLNEYGLLQPVCASCGGCQNPPPKLPEPVPRLPESITVQPATPGPFEPIPIMPEPIVPQPKPNPEQPIQEPLQPVSTPEPYPVHPTPEQVTLPTPVTFPEPVATLPPPSETAHCNPLPTGVPFTNPLHPCQLCICRESLVSGKTDVQIECKENPQCIAPADVTSLPPIPDVPMPIPLPICEKFPENVLFPHPTETCKLCKCAKSLSENGVYEQQITCYPHPDCVPKLEEVTEPIVPPLPIPVEPYLVKPTPEPLPIDPLSEPQQPMEPVPLPEVVTVEPLPWPPITTVAPVPALPVTPKPGPLPGPSPHESCQPYPPNQTFQHPWDECQVCVCTEAIAVGMITVEINCYTKPSCCIDPPDSVKAAIPGYNTPYLGSSNTVNSPEVPALSSGSQPTTTYRPPPAYPSYSPKSVNIYPGSNLAADPLNQPPIAPYSGFVDPSSNYPYQPNYAPQYVNPQYPEYPPRLPVLPGTGNTIGQYKPNHFGYPANYQYAQGDAVGNNYPPQGHYQPFDPRFQTVPAPLYPGMYQRAYERSPMFAPQLRENYVKPPIPAIGGPSGQNLATSYSAPMGYSKSGKDGPDDDV